MLLSAVIMNKHESGFTLVELAIVLVIVGVLAGTFLSTLGGRIDTTRRAETTDDLAVIKQALYGYAMSQANPSLPCPDLRSFLDTTAPNFPNDGKADLDPADPTKCDNDVYVGNLPWQTLGLGFSDAWNNRYTYWVSLNYVDTTITGFTLATDAVTAGTASTIQTRSGAVANPLSTNAIAVVISHGKNGYGTLNVQNVFTPAVPAANIDEVENADGADQLYMSRQKTEAGVDAAVGEFDDLLIWISEYELKAKMVEAAKLP